MSEWDQWVAVGDCLHLGVLAAHAGQPVPASHPDLARWIGQGRVVSTSPAAVVVQGVPARIVARTPPGTVTGGSGGGSSYPSGLPWASGVYSLVGSTSAIAPFQTMRGKTLDLIDCHPAWVDLSNSYWIDPLVGVAQNVCASTGLAGGSLGTPVTTAFHNLATMVHGAGFAAAYYRPGVEANLPTTDPATDSNKATWAARFNEAYAAIKAVSPLSTVAINFNEGLGAAGQISQSGVEYLIDNCTYDVLSIDYYDQWEAITTTAQAVARFGDGGTYGTMNWYLAQAVAHGKKFALPEWGVSSGTQWAGHCGGDNAFYITYVLNWLSTYRVYIEWESYFEETAAYLVSNLVGTSNPNAQAAYIAGLAAVV